MMDYFSQGTVELLGQLRVKLPQSLLLMGTRGVALVRAAQYLSGSASPITVTPDTSKKTPIITVEMIRNLHEYTRSKYTDRRIVVIEQAESMSVGAQAAFLKLLEEPGDNIHFILLSHQPERLLATIRSRVQSHTIKPLSDEESRAFISARGVGEQAKVTQLLYLASGRPEELERLIENESYFTESAAIVKDARALLEADSYQRILLAYQYKDNVSLCIRLIDLSIDILRRSMSQHPQEALTIKLQRLLELRQALQTNINPRTAIAYFMV